MKIKEAPTDISREKCDENLNYDHYARVRIHQGSLRKTEHILQFLNICRTAYITPFG